MGSIASNLVSCFSGNPAGTAAINNKLVNGNQYFGLNIKRPPSSIVVTAASSQN